MVSITITKEDIGKLKLETDVWYSLLFDGTILKAYKDGKLYKSIIAEPIIKE